MFGVKSVDGVRAISKKPMLLRGKVDDIKQTAIKQLMMLGFDNMLNN
jgi:hypothetical protein